MSEKWLNKTLIIRFFTGVKCLVDVSSRNEFTAMFTVLNSQTNKQTKITRPWPNKERAHNSAEEQRSTNHNLNKAEIFERRTWRRKDWNFLTIKNNNNWNFSLPVMSCERKDWNIALLNPKALLHDSKTYSNVFHFKLFLFFFFPLSLFFVYSFSFFGQICCF